MKKKLYLNENHFNSLLGRMQSKKNYDESLYIKQNLLTEGRKKVAGLVDSFKKSVDDAIEALYKGVDVPASTTKVITDLGDNITSLKQSFKPMDSFKYGGLGKNNLNFIGDVSEKITNTITSLNSLIKEIPSLNNEGAKMVEKLKRYDKSLNSLYYIDDFIKQGQTPSDALLSTLIRKKSYLGEPQKLIDDLDLLTVPDAVSGEVDELGKYWKEIKFNTELKNTDDVLKYIDDTFERLGFNIKKIKTAQSPLESLNKKLKSKGLDLDNDILIKKKDGEGFVVVNVKGFKDLPPETQKKVKIAINKELGGDGKTLTKADMEGIMTDAINKSNVGKTVWWHKVGIIAGIAVVAMPLLWAAGTLIGAIIRCIPWWSDNSQWDIFKKHEEEIQKKGVEVIEGGYGTCVGIKFVEYLLLPVNAIWGTAKDEFKQIWGNIIGLTEGSVKELCEKQTNNESGGCDCDKVADEFMISGDVDKLQNLVADIEPIINNETDENKKENYKNILKSAIEVNELPSFIFKNEELKIDFRELAKSTCLLMSVNQQIKDAKKLMEKFTPEYLGNMDWCDTVSVKEMKNTSGKLYNYAKKGIVYLSGDFDKNKIFVDTPKELVSFISKAGVEIKPEGEINQNLGANESAEEAFKIQYMFFSDLLSDLNDSKKKKVLCDENEETETESGVVVMNDLKEINQLIISGGLDLQNICNSTMDEEDLKNYLLNLLVEKKYDFGNDDQKIKDFQDKWWNRQLGNRTKANCE